MKRTVSGIEPDIASAPIDGTTRRQVVRAMIATPAALALPGGAFAADPPASPLKSFSTVARRSELSPDRFRQHWIGIHGPMARTVPGIGGFVLSEAVQGSAAAAPGAPYRDAFEGVAIMWYQKPDSMRAMLATPEAQAWLADGNLFVDRSSARNFFVNELIVVPPRAVGGRLKRTELLVRKPGMSHEAFMARWTGRHAEMARGMPGLIGCVFNRIEHAPGSQDDPWKDVDGIAELWWDDGAVDLGGPVPSPRSTAWLADADEFVDRARSRIIVSLDHVMIPPPTRA